MPSFLDGFADSFTSSLGAVAGIKQRRRESEAQTEHWAAEEDIDRQKLELQKQTDAAAIQQALSATGLNNAETQKIMTELTPEALERAARRAEEDIRLTGANADQALATAAQTELENQKNRLGVNARALDHFRIYHPDMSDEQIADYMRGGSTLPTPATGRAGALPEETPPGEEPPPAEAAPGEEAPEPEGGGDVAEGETADVPGSEPMGSEPEAGVMDFITNPLKRGRSALAAAPVTGRTLDNYLAMSREQLSQLPPEEYNRFVQMYEQASAAGQNPTYRTPQAAAPAITPVTPAAGAPAAAPVDPRVPQARPTPGARVPQARPTPPGQIDPRLPRQRPEHGYDTARVPRPRPGAQMYGEWGSGAVPPTPLPSDMAQGMAIQENVRGTDASAARDIQRNARPPSDVAAARATQGIRDDAIVAGAQNIRDEVQRPTDIARAQGLRGEVIEAQAGTRNKPLNERTKNMLASAAGETGVTVRVTSGAQPSSGSNRTGSHRHDTEVGAADIQLIDKSTGKVLSFEVAEDRAKMTAFLQAAKSNGATGFGAGLDYMGPTTLHVGFGSPAVWGAKGSKDNAPQWLRDALIGTPQGGGAIPGVRGKGSPRIAGNEVFNALGTRLPFIQAAVLAGSIQQESSGNPNALNEAEGAHGIIQWRDSRWDDLQGYAADHGGNPNDLQTQIGFLIEEGSEGTAYGTPQDKAAWAKFMAAKTPEEANAALKGFIRWGEEGNRLNYAKELIGQSTDTGPATTGSISSEGGPRMSRTVVSDRSNAAVKAGMNYNTQTAGLNGPVPAITDTGRASSQREYLTAANADTKGLNRAREAVQKSLAGDTMTEAELNSATLAQTYDWYMNVEGDPKAAQAAAGQILQAFRAKHNQFMGWAQVLAQEGKMDQAAQAAAKAYAQVPDGQDATFKFDQENNTFTVTTKDLEGNPVTEQIITPEQLYAGIMGWSPIDFDKRLMAAAGEKTTSESFDAQTGYMAASAIPEGQQPLSPQSESIISPQSEIREPMVPNLAGITDAGERTALIAQSKLQPSAEQQTEKIYGKPFSIEEQQKLGNYITSLQTGVDEAGAETGVNAAAWAPKFAAIQSLVPNNPEEANRIVTKVFQMNRAKGVPVETVINDLATISQIDPANPGFNFTPVSRTGETITVQAAGSNDPITIPITTWGTIQRGLMAKVEAATGEVVDPNAVRDAGTAAESAAALGREEEARRNRKPPTGRSGIPMETPGGRSRSGQPMYGP